MNRHLRRSSRIAALLVLLSLNSCITAAMWNSARCAHGKEVAVLIALTPITLFADLLLLPVESCAMDDGCYRSCGR